MFCLSFIHTHLDNLCLKDLRKLFLKKTNSCTEADFTYHNIYVLQIYSSVIFNTLAALWRQHHNTILERLSPQKEILCPLAFFPAPPSPWLILCLYGCATLSISNKRTPTICVFGVLPLSFRIMLSVFTHVVAWVNSSFFFIVDWHSVVMMCLSVYQLMDMWVVSAFWLSHE